MFIFTLSTMEMMFIFTFSVSKTISNFTLYAILSRKNLLPVAHVSQGFYFWPIVTILLFIIEIIK